jgi:hypothetical protein
MGAGGMWLNYLVWCSKFDTNLPGELNHFEFPDVEAAINADPALHYYVGDRTQYHSFIQQRKHSVTWHDCEIVLGSDRAWFNFFLNLQKKKGRAEDDGGRYQIAAQYAGWMRRGLQFNLDWCLIWEDPEQFLTRLNELAGFELKYNSGAQQAFEQYRRSCVFEPGEGDLDVYQRAVYDLATDQETTNEQARLQRAREIVYTTWYRI